MRCAHCKENGPAITVDHVKTCSRLEQAIKGIGHPEPVRRVYPVTEEGFYFTGAEYVKVLRSERGHLYAKVWDGYGWEFTAGLLRLLTADQRITAEQAKQFGVLYSRCVYCSRKLTDDRSIAAGYGPVCADLYRLPWGERQVAEAAA